jgi:8-oxo-dGTP pyrophosphatase MutT (NUDIX family)
MVATVGDVVKGGAGDPVEIEAATVVLLRDADGGPECLMVAKTEGQFFGGLWVFPGGRVEADEGSGLEGARRAAVREAEEETRLRLEPDALVPLSHWEPPPEAAKRFLTWFFVAALPDDAGDVVIDGGEIGDHVWTTPEAALAAHSRGEIKLLPPTWVTLYRLSGHEAADTAVAAARKAEPERFSTRIVAGATAGEVDQAEGAGKAIRAAMVALWDGDAAYPEDGTAPPGPLATPGPRHRLVMDDTTGWHYERTLS